MALATSRRARLAWLGSALVLLGLIVAPGVGAATAAPPGNNGDVKVNAADDRYGGPENDPHVCTFFLSFDNFDPGQTGSWGIESWPPAGNGATVLWGSYVADAGGSYRTPASGTYGLPAGHYKLFWQGRNDANVKHKVFWVACQLTPTPIPTPTATSTTAATATPAAATPAATATAATATPAAATPAAATPAATATATPAAATPAAAPPTPAPPTPAPPTPTATSTGEVLPVTGTPAPPTPSVLPVTSSDPANGGPSNESLMILLGLIGAASLSLVATTMVRERLLDRIER